VERGELEVGELGGAGRPGCAQAGTGVPPPLQVLLPALSTGGGGSEGRSSLLMPHGGRP
jgi:hypothetical protein